MSCERVREWRECGGAHSFDKGQKTAHRQKQSIAQARTRQRTDQEDWAEGKIGDWPQTHQNLFTINVGAT